MDDFYDGMTTLQFLEVQAKAKTKRPPRQRGQKTVVDDIPFDSLIEADQYCELKIRERAGDIQHLEARKKHLKFVIQKRTVYPFTREIIRQRIYTADFKFWDVARARWIVQDVKGYRVSKKTGKWLPVVNESFHFRWDSVRLQYPQFEFELVLRKH